MNENSNPAGNPIISEARVANEGDSQRPDESEFSRFEELTGKLVSVPKTELDEKRKSQT